MKYVLIILVVLFIGILPAQVNPDSLSYKINKGDVISINVMDHTEFSYGQLIVMPDGFIQYPGIGSIRVEGISLKALRDSIYVVVNQYVPNPLITVNVNQIYNHNINVLGDVNRQGTYQTFEPVDILFALSLAGGAKAAGNSKITLLHADGKVDKTRLKKVFNDRNALKNNPDFLVYPYDTVVVEQPAKVNWALVSVFLSAISVFTTLYFRTN